MMYMLGYQENIHIFLKSCYLMSTAISETFEMQIFVLNFLLEFWLKIEVM